MEKEKLRIIYEDDDLLAIDKPSGITVFSEDQTPEKTLIDLLLEQFPGLKNAGKTPRYGIIHRLDKDTSGILLTAKTNAALDFFQKEFKNQRVEKKYLALAVGKIKGVEGTVETLIGRSKKDKRKQKAYLPFEPGSQGKKKAVTKYKVLESFDKYTLLEVYPKTGRKHQIRAHLSYLQHPIAGDKMYGFRNQPCPKGLKRQFLHASYLKINLPGGKEKEFHSELPEELKEILKNI